MLIRKSNLLYFFIVLVLLQPFFRKFEFFRYDTFFNLLDEIMLVILSPIAFKGMQVAFNNKNLRMFFLLFLSYVVFGVFSSLYNSNPFLAVIYQLIDSVKFLLVLMIFLGAKLDAVERNKIVYFIKFVLVLSLFLTVFKYISITAYRNVFSGSLLGLINSQGSFIYNSEGAFWHASEVAFFAASAFIFFYFGRWEGHRIFWLTLSFLVLILAIQRQELASMLIAIFIYWLVFDASKSKTNKIIVLFYLFGMASLFILVNLPSITTYLFAEIRNLGLDYVEYSEAARIVMLRDSAFIASEYFPLGSGLGSFGGLGAYVANRDLYEELLYNAYYWYREDMFLLDVGWSQVIAEAGWIGFSIYILAIYNLLIYFRNQVTTDFGIESKVAFCIFITFLINSITSSNLTSIFFLTLSFFWIALIGKDKSQVVV